MAFSELLLTSHDVIAASNESNLVLVRTLASGLIRLESRIEVNANWMRIETAL